MNYIVITIDALRPDHLSLYGYKRPTDAALEPYRSHLAVFENCFTYSFPTVRAFPALMSSIWPSLCQSEVPWQYMRKINLPKWAKTLAQCFKEHGYFCASHSCWTAFLTPLQGYAKGADLYAGMLREDAVKGSKRKRTWLGQISQSLIYTLRYLPSEEFVLRFERAYHWIRDGINSVFKTKITEPPGMSGRNGKTVTDFVLGAIESRSEKPFFVWAHYLDAHIPLAPPDQFSYNPGISSETKQLINRAILKQRPVSAELKQDLVDLYDGGIRTAFHEVGRIFQYLEQKSMLDNTCVIITSDHGYGLWEHSFWETPYGFFSDESIRVPLIIYHPKMNRTEKRIKAPVSLMDFAPTLTSLAGFDEDKNFFGKSFSSLLTNAAAEQKEIWLESMDTAGGQNMICRIFQNKKIIYSEIKKCISEILNLKDEPEQITAKEEELFLESLKNYEAAKRNFCTRRKSHTAAKYELQPTH